MKICGKIFIHFVHLGSNWILIRLFVNSQSLVVTVVRIRRFILESIHFESTIFPSQNIYLLQSIVNDKERLEKGQLILIHMSFWCNCFHQKTKVFFKEFLPQPINTNYGLFNIIGIIKFLIQLFLEARAEILPKISRHFEIN